MAKNNWSLRWWEWLAVLLFIAFLVGAFYIAALTMGTF